MLFNAAQSLTPVTCTVSSLGEAFVLSNSCRFPPATATSGSKYGCNSASPSFKSSGFPLPSCLDTSFLCFERDRWLFPNEAARPLAVLSSTNRPNDFLFEMLVDFSFYLCLLFAIFLIRSLRSSSFAIISVVISSCLSLRHFCQKCLQLAELDRVKAK